MIKAKYEMGKIAMEILLQMIEGKDEGNRQVALHHRCLFTIVLIGRLEIYLF
jgi:DNA-binding LacI/PurR family transcriptional regulator